MIQGRDASTSASLLVVAVLGNLGIPRGRPLETWSLNQPTFSLPLHHNSPLSLRHSIPLPPYTLVSSSTKLEVVISQLRLEAKHGTAPALGIFAQGPD
jgi:hypothetical protein